MKIKCNRKAIWQRKMPPNRKAGRQRPARRRSQTGSRKNISGNCLPIRPKRWQERVGEFFSWSSYFGCRFIGFCKTIQRTDCSYDNNCWRDVTKGDRCRRCYERACVAFRFSVSNLFDSFNAVFLINKGPEISRAILLLIWFSHDFYTIMVNDLLITTTDTYRYLCFCFV